MVTCAFVTCLEGTVLGFHCKASNFPIKSCNSVRILGLLICLSQRPKGSRLTNDIFYSYVSIRRSENKHQNLAETDPRILVLPGALWKPGREQVCELVSLTWEKGWKPRTRPRPLEKHPSLDVLGWRHIPWIMPPRLLHSTILAKEHILPAQPV